MFRSLLTILHTLRQTLISNKRRRTQTTHAPSMVLESRQLLSGSSAGVVRGDQWLLNTNSDSVQEIDLQYGFNSDQKVTGKWGTATRSMPGVVRNGADGLLHWYLDTNGDPSHEVEIKFGLPGDRPVVGDWDANGSDNVGVVRVGGDGLLHWYLDTDGDPTHEREAVFGLPGDIPVVGDWDGNGTDDPAVIRRDGNGLLHWYFDTQQNPANPVHESDAAFGLPGDMPVVGDWNRDGKDDPGVVRTGSDGLLHWYLDTDRDPIHEAEWTFGLPGDHPVVGDWSLPEVQVFDVDRQVELFDGDRYGLNWGELMVNQSAPQKSILIRNTGNQPLLISRIEIPAGVQLVTTQGGLGSTGATIAPGAEARVDLKLTTSSPIGVSGFLKLHTNDGNENPFDLPVLAAVRSPVSDIEVVGVTDGQSEVIDIGTAVRGANAPSRTFRVINQGRLDLIISRIQLPTGFAFLPPDNAPRLAPGAWTEFTVALDTSKAGAPTGEIRISSNDPDESIFNFRISGNVTDLPAGPGPEIRVTGPGNIDINDDQSNHIDFGVSLAGVAQTRTFTIYNVGNSDLKLGKIGTSHPIFEIVTQPASIVKKGGKTTFTVRARNAYGGAFQTGSQTGQFDAKLSFTTNDSDESQFDIPVRTTVVASPRSPEIEVIVSGVTLSPGQLVGQINFGAQTENAIPRAEITIRNIGSGDLSLSSFQLDRNRDFRVSNIPSRPLRSNEVVTIVVTMNSNPLGIKEDVLRFGSNDSDEGAFVVSLRGKTLPNVRTGIGSALHYRELPGFSGGYLDADQVIIEPANGDVDRGAVYVVTTIKAGRVISRLSYDSYLESVTVRKGTTVENWTRVRVKTI